MPENTMTRPHRDDTPAIDILIAAHVLAPGARTMTNREIAAQHNGANAYAPGDPGFLDPDEEFITQAGRIINATAARPEQDLYSVRIEQRTTFDSVIAVPAGTNPDTVQAIIEDGYANDELKGRDRVYDDGAEITPITGDDVNKAYINQYFTANDIADY